MEATVKTALRLACFVLLLSLAVRAAEIEKRAQMCPSGICLYWWPKLPPIKGWHQDQNFSYHYGVDALAPDGFTFSNAVAVMYANAAYKPRDPRTKSLQMSSSMISRAFVPQIPEFALPK